MRWPQQTKTLYCRSLETTVVNLLLCATLLSAGDRYGPVVAGRCVACLSGVAHALPGTKRRRGRFSMQCRTVLRFARFALMIVIIPTVCEIEVR